MDGIIRRFFDERGNYEDVIEEALIDGLKQKFGIKDNNKAIAYAFARCAVLNGRPSISDSSKFISFILQELCIPTIDDGNGGIVTFYHDNEIIDVKCGYSNKNSLINIFNTIESVFIREKFVDKEGDESDANTYVQALISYINKHARQKLKPYKESRYSNEILILFKLQLLNEEFCVKAPTEAPLIQEFDQRDSRMSIEALYERYLHAENFDTTNVHCIAESVVRDYLYIHLDLIEDGLGPVMKEYQTKEGRVDIVAKDKDENLVVIELKTENDKRLIWQCMYYPEEVKNGLGAYDADKAVRMITVAPEYPDHIKKPLEKLGYVESFTYTIKAFNGTIEEINVKACEQAKIEKEKEEKEEKEIDCEMQKSLDGLIDAFMYTRKQLAEKCGDAGKVKDFDDIALRLVEMAMRNGRRSRTDDE